MEELNDSAIGFNARYYEEDMRDVRDLMLQRMLQAEEEKRARAVRKAGPATAPAKEASAQELRDEIARLKAQLEQANNRAAKAEEGLKKERDAVPTHEKGAISKFFGI